MVIAFPTMNVTPFCLTTMRPAALALISLLGLESIHAALPVEPRTAESAVTPVEKSRHSDFMRQIKAAGGNFDFVLIGDSITDFWPRSGKDSYARFAPWKPLDLGVSGETTEEVLWRLQNGELDGIHPKVFMIMIGTNNTGHYPDEKPEWVAAGIKKIVETVRGKHPDSKILLVGIFPRGVDSKDSVRRRNDEVNALLPALQDGKHVFFLDIGPKFLDPQGVLSTGIMPDRLHPNAEGYRIWSEAVRPTLEELMGSPMAPLKPQATPSPSASPHSPSIPSSSPAR
jgi:lysophospholipase L1-like esterase